MQHNEITTKEWSELKVKTIDLRFGRLRNMHEILKYHCCYEVLQQEWAEVWANYRVGLLN